MREEKIGESGMLIEGVHSVELVCRVSVYIYYIVVKSLNYSLDPILLFFWNLTQTNVLLIQTDLFSCISTMFDVSDRPTQQLLAEL